MQQNQHIFLAPKSVHTDRNASICQDRLRTNVRNMRGVYVNRLSSLEGLGRAAGSSGELKTPH